MDFNVDNMMAFEAGELSETDTITFFQAGIDNGMVWSLQGFYGRAAQTMITMGFCTPKR